MIVHGIFCHDSIFSFTKFDPSQRKGLLTKLKNLLKKNDKKEEVKTVEDSAHSPSNDDKNVEHNEEDSST